MAFCPMPTCVAATPVPPMVASMNVMILWVTLVESVTVIVFDVSIWRVMTQRQTEIVEPSSATPPAVSVYSATLV
jgi:hypothetical protein